MFPVLELRGSGYQRGHAHGELARGRVERSLANYGAQYMPVALAAEPALA